MAWPQGNIVAFSSVIFITKKLHMKNVLFSIFLLSMLMASCEDNINCINGNRQPDTKEIQIGNITQITNTTQADLIYRKSDTISMKIFAESNLIDHIVVSQAGDRLEIRTEPKNTCFDYTVRPRIMISSPVLSIMELTGSGNFEADTLSGNSVLVRLTGSGDIFARRISCGELTVTHTGSGSTKIEDIVCQSSDFTNTGSGELSVKGRGDEGIFRVTGSGNIEALDFILQTANETITGSGDIYTQVITSLNAVITGSGNIYLRGNPVVTQSITGSGRVIGY